MAERDALTVLTEELPKLAAAAKKLKHPVLELLIEQAQAELATLAGARQIPAGCSRRHGRSQPSEGSGAAE